MSQNTSDPRPASRWALLAAALYRHLLAVLSRLAAAVSRALTAAACRGLPPVDMTALLDGLAPVEYRPAADDDRLFEEASIAKVLLLMLRVNQESEYLLCRAVAEHALGTVPEPGAPLG